MIFKTSGYKFECWAMRCTRPPHGALICEQPDGGAAFIMLCLEHGDRYMKGEPTEFRSC